MTTPTSPYCTNAQVAYLLQNQFFNVAPSGVTIPTDTVIDSIILWTDSVIEATFRGIGYKIPFAVMVGESWPSSQTTFLGYLSAVGTAAQVSGYILTPVPSRGVGRGTGDESVFGRMFDRIKNDILNTGLGFRADYYLGTPAEKWLSEPYGPRIDFTENYEDPTRYELLKDYTDRILKEYDEVAAMNIDWDYLYALRASTAD